MNKTTSEKQPFVIAVVEDEEDIRNNVAMFLEAQGFIVWSADSAESFYRQMLAQRPDLVIVDIGLPGEDGLSLISYLHDNTGIALVALTARGSSQDQAAGLNAGADYYFVKPADPYHLLAGIKAVLRKRSGADKTADDTLNRWMIMRQDAILYAPDGTTIPLSAREVQLLEYLMARPDTVITKTELLALCSKGGDADDYNKIEAVVSRLRRKVTETAAMRLPLRVVHGQGLSFVGRSTVKA